jgi:hypothetical protein
MGLNWASPETRRWPPASIAQRARARGRCASQQASRRGCATRA